MKGPEGFIAFFRWTSALLVVLNHARALSLIGFDRIEAHKMLLAPFYLFTSLGMQAVMVFFILSGYLVGGKAIERARNRDFSLKSYAIDRTTRIYCVLIPALLLTIAMDSFGTAFASDGGLYDRSATILADRFATPFQDANNWLTLACNAAQAQPLHCPVLGSNIPLWSLSLEAWYYIAAGAVAAMIQYRKPVSIVSALLAMALLYVFVGPVGLTLGAMWVLGAVIYLYRDNPVPKIFAKPQLWTVVFIGSLVISTRLTGAVTAGPIQISYLQLLAGISFALLFNAIVRCPVRFFNSPWHERMAASSFSLYLIHFPILVLFNSTLITWTTIAIGPKSGYQPTAVNLAAMGASVAFALIFAWIFAAVFERGSYRARNWLKYGVGSQRGNVSAMVNRARERPCDL